MPDGRPAIPAQLRRDVLVEAGHRCAIPSCRAFPIEINHIVPWARVQEHTFENLIALCANCHARYTNGEIDRKAMQQYKANLADLNQREIAETVRSLEARFAELVRDTGPPRLQSQPHKSMFIASSVFFERVLSEDINFTGPGDTHVELAISGSLISDAHVERLLRVYQAHFHNANGAPAVDVNIRSDNQFTRRSIPRGLGL